MKNKIVYSTDPNYSINDDSEVVEKREPNEQNLRIWYEKRPGNKVVSVVRGYTGSAEDMTAIAKTIKKKCGVGGSVKNGEIIIQTKEREKILNILTKLGFRVKLSGG